MIWFFNLERASAGACDNYNELFQYLKKQEKLDLEDTQAPDAIASNVGIQTLRKQQCLDYCKAHNYVVIENSAT